MKNVIGAYFKPQEHEHIVTIHRCDEMKRFKSSREVAEILGIKVSVVNAVLRRYYRNSAKEKSDIV